MLVNLNDSDRALAELLRARQCRCWFRDSVNLKDLRKYCSAQPKDERDAIVADGVAGPRMDQEQS